jgi:FolB domain-containing protein
VSDRIEKTVNYHDVAQDLLKYGEGRSWKLLEKLVTNIADFLLAKYRPQAVAVEIKKFAIPQARHVAVSLTKTRPR